MATITATAASTNVSPRVIHAGLYSITGGPFTLSPSAGDVIQMLKVPAGFAVKELLVIGNAASTVAYQVGDGFDPNRWLSASALAVLPIRMGAGLAAAADTTRYTYSANDTIDITIDTVASPTASATITLTLIATGCVDDNN